MFSWYLASLGSPQGGGADATASLSAGGGSTSLWLGPTGLRVARFERAAGGAVDFVDPQTLRGGSSV